VREATWPVRECEPSDRRRAGAEWLCYQEAGGHARGKRVLDVDCGAGYGSWLLGRAGAAQVVGVGEDPAALDWARGRFAGPSVQFREGSARSLPLASSDVDLAVSLETLERQRDVPAVVEELHRVLAPGGLLLLSTPLARGPERLRPQNPLHVREYDELELAALLAPRFSITGRLGLHRPPGPLRTRADGLVPLLERELGRLLPEPLRALGGRLLRGAPPLARIVAAGWEQAPFQLVLARRAG
jgi:SAM-dependent methyltransferase